MITHEAVVAFWIVVGVVVLSVVLMLMLALIGLAVVLGDLD